MRCRKLSSSFVRRNVSHSHQGLNCFIVRIWEGRSTIRRHSTVGRYLSTVTPGGDGCTRRDVSHCVGTDIRARRPVRLRRRSSAICGPLTIGRLVSIHGLRRLSTADKLLDNSFPPTAVRLQPLHVRKLKGTH